MKAIAVYSGKGGVGKTTISALLALALAKKHTVALLDMDLNFKGSIPVMFKEGIKIENLSIFSVGYETRSTVFLGNMAKKVLRDLVNKVLDCNPEICIIDMPPGATDAHMRDFCVKSLLNQLGTWEFTYTPK